MDADGGEVGGWFVLSSIFRRWVSERAKTSAAMAGGDKEGLFSPNRQIINWMGENCVILFSTVRNKPRPGTADPGTSKPSWDDLTETK